MIAGYDGSPVSSTCSCPLCANLREQGVSVEETTDDMTMDQRESEAVDHSMAEWAETFAVALSSEFWQLPSLK